MVTRLSYSSPGKDFFGMDSGCPCPPARLFAKNRKAKYDRRTTGIEFCEWTGTRAGQAAGGRADPGELVVQTDAPTRGPRHRLAAGPGTSPGTNLVPRLPPASGGPGPGTPDVRMKAGGSTQGRRPMLLVKAKWGFGIGGGFGRATCSRLDPPAAGTSRWAEPGRRCSTGRGWPESGVGREWAPS